MSVCCDIMSVSKIHKNSFIVFFRKSGFIRRHTIAQKDFERTCAAYCISREKGFASRLRRTESFQTDDAKSISVMIWLQHGYFWLSEYLTA